MAVYMVRNVHTPEECDRLEREWENKAPAELKGSLRLFCTCPSGEHGAFFELEADSPERALAGGERRPSGEHHGAAPASTQEKH